jgi:hypothetical protein
MPASQPINPSTSQPGGGGGTSQPQYPGPNNPLNPFADFSNAGAAINNAAHAASSAQQLASTAGGALKRLLDPSFWKGLGLLFGAVAIGVVGLWLWFQGDNASGDASSGVGNLRQATSAKSIAEAAAE